VTDYAKNLRTASDIIARRMGIETANMSYGERREYNRQLAQFILERPADFSSASVTTARLVLDTPIDSLDDESFSWGDFGNEVGSTAAKLGFTVSSGVIVGLSVLLLFPHVKKLFK